jgi:hypothetical protein
MSVYATKRVSGIMSPSAVITLWSQIRAELLSLSFLDARGPDRAKWLRTLLGTVQVSLLRLRFY